MLAGALVSLLARARRVSDEETPPKPPKGMTCEQVQIMDKWLDRPRPKRAEPY